MSLLDRWNAVVTVFPEIEWFDKDGNLMTGPSDEGYQQKVMIQPLAMSGTSSRRAEQDNEGFETEANYRMRPVRGAAPIDAQARIDWNGQYWAINGDYTEYNSSYRTRHRDYVIRRT